MRARTTYPYVAKIEIFPNPHIAALTTAQSHHQIECDSHPEDLSLKANNPAAHFTPSNFRPVPSPANLSISNSNHEVFLSHNFLSREIKKHETRDIRVLGQRPRKFRPVGATLSLDEVSLSRREEERGSIVICCVVSCVVVSLRNSES